MSPFPYINVARVGNNLSGKVGLSRKICQANCALLAYCCSTLKQKGDLVLGVVPLQTKSPHNIKVN
jgi:hypothetical protein